MINNLIHHYTSIETLALILKHRKIRFSRLDQVDDLKEIEEFPRAFATYVFISCWTDESEESIPLWKMYTQNLRGVRISFPVDMFKKKIIKAGDYGYHGFTQNMVSPLSYDEAFTEKYFLANDFNNQSSFYKKVEYDNNYLQLYKSLIFENEKEIKIQNFFSLGVYKRENWKFQNEFRFTLYVFPLLPLNHPLINGSRQKQFENVTYSIFNNIKNDIEYFDVELDDNVVNNISLKLGPLCTDSDKIMVESLLNRFTDKGRFETSNLHGIIRK